MAFTATPVLPQSPTIGTATLTSPTAVTARTNITGTTGLTSLTPTVTNARKVDYIRVIGKATTVAGLVSIWLYDGTTSTLVDEIAVTAVTPSTTAVAFKTDMSYSGTRLIIPAGSRLYVSVTVANDLNIYAMGGDY